ncbi:MAG: nucleotidyltransferase family protein, partial [Ruminococcus sp.]|nr:nucleotidyltransferase family protein [Ruminococcus sp.]
MHVAGVVAEYNPFHNGHKYHLEQTGKMGADHIVVVMSGDAVQRGDVAVYSKYERAQIALKYGADLVLELSAPYSCAPAQVFAENAVRLLAGFGEGVVNSISFGCACDNAQLLEKAQQRCAQLEDSEQFKELISEGLSYPAAMQKAAESDCEDIKNILSDANNVLAIEYIKAAKRFAPWIKLMCVERNGVFHDEMEVNGDLASATLVRKMIRYKTDLSKLVPELPDCEPAFLDNMDKALLFRIITADEDLVEELPFMSQSLANRFYKTVQKCPQSVAEFESLIKSKDITMARIRRMVMHLALGICELD